MLNILKTLIYFFFPTSLYLNILYFVKKNRLKKKISFFFIKNKNKLVISHLRKKIKNNNKIFILGSGPSIRDLSFYKFKEISKSISVGINKWIFHEFVADFYLLELKLNKYNELRGFKNLNSKYKNRIAKLLKNKKKPVFIIYCSHFNLFEIEEWSKIAQHPRVFFYEYLRPNMIKKNIQLEFLKTLEYIIQSSRKSNVCSLGIGSSIERAVSIGMILGFSKIILLGVDLKNRKYFWNKNEKNFKDLNVQQKGFGFHKTATRGFLNFPIQKSLLIMDKVGRKKFNSKILISTSKSLLSSKLERYKWSNHKV